MGRQMRQNAVDFLLHSLEIYGALYLFHTALWEKQKNFQNKFVRLFFYICEKKISRNGRKKVLFLWYVSYSSSRRNGKKLSHKSMFDNFFFATTFFVPPTIFLFIKESFLRPKNISVCAWVNPMKGYFCLLKTISYVCNMYNDCCKCYKCYNSDWINTLSKNKRVRYKICPLKWKLFIVLFPGFSHQRDTECSHFLSSLKFGIFFWKMFSIEYLKDVFLHCISYDVFSPLKSLRTIFTFYKNDTAWIRSTHNLCYIQIPWTYNLWPFRVDTLLKIHCYRFST